MKSDDSGVQRQIDELVQMAQTSARQQRKLEDQISALKRGLRWAGVVLGLVFSVVFVPMGIYVVRELLRK